jgi:uncharacterized protein
MQCDDPDGAQGDRNVSRSCAPAGASVARAPEAAFCAKVRRAADLIWLERPADEAVLLNGWRGLPVHVRRGAAHLRALFAELERTPALGALLDERPEDAALLRLLLEQGAIERMDAPARLPSVGATAQTRRPGCSLYLLLSQSCTMACAYCLAGERTYEHDKPDRMERATAVAAIDQALGSLAPGGRLEIVFFGGEPLRHWPLARELMESKQELLGRYPDRRVHFHLTTGLSILPRDLIEVARRHQMTVLVDIDGPAEIHDKLRPLRGGRPSHHIVARNVERLVKAGIPVSLRATVTRTNVDRMIEVARHHRDLGATGSAFVPVNPVDSDGEILPVSMWPCPADYAAGLRACFASGLWAPDKLFPFNQYLSRLGPQGAMVQACGAPYANTPVVDSAGDIYPCIYWVGHPRLRMGTLANQGLKRADGAVAEALRARLGVDRRARCRECVWRYRCGGGCPATTVLLEGHPGATPEVTAYADEMACATSRAVLETLLWHKARSTGEAPND